VGTALGSQAPWGQFWWEVLWLGQGTEAMWESRTPSLLYSEAKCLGFDCKVTLRLTLNQQELLEEVSPGPGNDPGEGVCVISVPRNLDVQEA
jgi:hypothetical protein